MKGGERREEGATARTRRNQQSIAFSSLGDRACQCFFVWRISAPRPRDAGRPCYQPDAAKRSTLTFPRDLRGEGNEGPVESASHAPWRASFFHCFFACCCSEAIAAEGGGGGAANQLCCCSVSERRVEPVASRCCASFLYVTIERGVLASLEVKARLCLAWSERSGAPPRTGRWGKSKTPAVRKKKKKKKKRRQRILLLLDPDPPHPTPPHPPPLPFFFFTQP